MFSRWLAFFFILFAGLIPVGAFGDSIRVMGSDLLGPAIQTSLESEAARAGVTIDTTFSGTWAARTALESGQADVVLLALPVDRSLPDGWERFPLAFEAVAVVVHENNPLEAVTLAALANLFAAGSDGFSRWGRAGAEEGWAERQAIPHVYRSRDSLGLELFKTVVLRERSIASSVTYSESPAAVLRQVAGNQAAIGLVPAAALLPAGVRVLPIQGQAGSAVEPTSDALFSGAYPLRLPYWIAWKDDLRSEATAAMRLLLSEPIAQALKEAGYEPVPAAERDPFLLALESETED